MSARKMLAIMMILTVYSIIACTLIFASNAKSGHSFANAGPVFQDTLAHRLGWVLDSSEPCGGYYREEPFVYPVNPEKENVIETTGNEGVFSFQGASTIEGKVTINRAGQQITANKAILYREKETGKLNAIDMIGNVHLREPNTLIIAKEGHYNFITKEKAFRKILYRSTLNGKNIAGPKISEEETKIERKVTGMTAWGQAYTFSQTQTKIYELTKASFTTCPPINPAWRLKASHIELNKNTGRGYAKHAKFLVKNVPVFYFPYISFSIDKQRKSGFLWPTLGVSNEWGPYVLAPFYWNMAPNYDMTITTGLLSKRGVQLTDNFRYLTETSTGKLNVSVLPNDQAFYAYQKSSQEKYGSSTNLSTQANLNRLVSASTTRQSLLWRNDSQFNEHWSSHIDFNYASDDYYLRNFGSSLNEITQNLLLQEGDIVYKGENWNFTGRVQAYQTLHPLADNEAITNNPYRRFPQLILNGTYPDQLFGTEYFINNEVTHFEILKTPGTDTLLPVGNRINIQPGVKLPIYGPSFYINPRIQLAMTQYELHQTADTNAPTSKRRAIPILDIASGLSLSRHTTLFNHTFLQTLEPQVYYTYIPYRNQSSIPIFDTTVNTLTYDQLFNYNRFSGIDRIGDANQIGVGVTTRFIDQLSGFEKIRLGIGEIVYFTDRRVTLCNSANECSDNPTNRSNFQRLSPLSALFNYNVNQNWSFVANTIWNPVVKQIDNMMLNLHYQPDERRILNLGYSYARNGDIFSGISTNNTVNNLKVTDFSFVWPVFRDISAVGRLSQDWHMNHFQNLLYGLQYDTCCWALKLVGGRAFTNLSLNNSPQYNNQFYIQFDLKGLGNIDSGSRGLLSSISGYHA